MRLKSNIDMMVSNLALQGSGAVAILLIPKFLPVAEYGKITTITTLLSLAALSDMGFSNVYNRKMPAVLAHGDADEAEAWNATAIRMKMVGSLVFGLVLGGFYWWRYGDPVVSALVCAVCVLTSSTSFFVSRAIVISDFAAARTLNILQAVLRLSTIPGAAVSGVAGWCLGQVAATAGLLANGQLRRWWWQDARGPFRWRLLRENCREALLLVLVTNVWLQVLSFGRAFAAFGYPDEVIARYGLVNAAYQAAASLCIAAFVPQTVRIYALLAQDREAALDCVARSVARTFPAMVLLVAAAIWATPPLFDLVFPQYAVPRPLVVTLLLTLVCYPLLLTLGSLLVGTGRSGLYLALVLGALTVALGTALGLSASLGYNAAAFAQLLAVSLLAGGLCIAVAVLFRRRRTRLLPLWIAGGVSLLAPGAWVVYYQGLVLIPGIR